MIKAIFFDIDDTIFPSTDFSTLARRNAINAMIGIGFPGEYDEIETKLKKIIAAKGSNYQNHFDMLCREFKVKRPARFVAAAVAAYHDTKTAIAPFPEVPRTLMELRERGYRLYVATNGNAVKQWDKLIRLRIALYFDDVFVSEEVGREKDKEFFKIILKQLLLSPMSCVMVGDREEADIAPALAAGMNAIRYRAGKYGKTATKADFTIRNFDGIIRIMERL